MSRYYRQKGCLLLHPPTLYGRQHSYRTRCREYFASVDLCQLASTKKHFRFAAILPGETPYLRLYMIVVLSINIFMKEVYTSIYVKEFYLANCSD